MKRFSIMKPISLLLAVLAVWTLLPSANADDSAADAEKLALLLDATKESISVGNFEKAEKLLDDAVTIDPNNIAVKILREKLDTPTKDPLKSVRRPKSLLFTDNTSDLTKSDWMHPTLSPKRLYIKDKVNSK